MTARTLVIHALLKQETGGYSNLVLDAQLQKNQLEPREKAFATAIFYGVLEHQNTIDYCLNQFLKKDVNRLDAPVRAILRSALVQMQYMQVPHSAAVNEAVKLAKAFKKTSAAGMVNAVLRRAVSYDINTAKFKNEAEKLSVLCSVSESMAKWFLKNYESEAYDILTAKTQNILTEIRVNPLLITARELKEILLLKGAKSVSESYLPNCLLVEFVGSPAATEAFEKGFYHVVGQTSQIAALALKAQKGDTVIDFCAAPAGKSLIIAQEMQNSGQLYSCDVSKNRVSLIEKALTRGQIICAKSVQNDATMQNPSDKLVDKILADVPCSGFGILDKKPDIRYKTIKNQNELLEIQSKILDNAANSLKNGGRLVYSTCTINPDENEKQIEAFLSRHSNFTVKPIENLPQGMKVSVFGALSLTNHTGLDGFFICAMEKN